MKRILLLLSALIITTSLLAHDIKVNGIYYNLDKSNKTVQVTYSDYEYSYDNVKYSGVISIPETISYYSVTYSVTSIGTKAFSGCTDLTSVTIPNSVMSIGTEAFSGCTDLTSVTIPNSVMSIGTEAFSGCTGLTSVTITNGVMSIGTEAFSRCSGLTSVTIPNSVTSIGTEAFSGCTALTSVTIQNSITYIGDDAFYNTSLYNDESNWVNGILYIDNCIIDAKSDVVEGSYSIKEGTRSIPPSAFSDCSRLTSVTIPNSVTSIGSRAFWNCSNLMSVEIGDGVKEIGSDAFYGCSGLVSVTIPNSVTSIGDYAFDGCSGLVSVTIPKSVTSIGNSAFYGCSALTSVEIGDGVTSIGEWAFNHCSSLTSIVWKPRKYPDFKYDDDSPFYYVRSQITSFTIGNEVESIPNNLLYEMDNIKEISFHSYPNNFESSIISEFSSLTSINWNVRNGKDFNISPFYDIRYQITSFTFGNEVEYIPANICYGLYYLKEITIPNSVTTIGSEAFYYSGLTKVNYLGTVDEWVKINFDNNPASYAEGLYINDVLLKDVKITSADSIKKNAFKGCKSIKSVVIGASVTSIGDYAFYACSGLTSITIPNSVTSIGNRTFYDCSSLTSVEIGESVNEIGSYAFSGCSSLTSVAIPKSVTSIGNSAFSDCSSLTSVEIGESVNEIGSYAFSGCSSLTSVAIPKSVTSIGNSAFSDCSSLTSVEIGESVNEIGSYAFSDCSRLTSVTIPNSVTSIGNSAFYGCSGLTSVIIPTGVTSIGSRAFWNCSNLMSVVWNVKYCKGFSTYTSSNPPFNDIAYLKIGDEVESIPAYFCYYMDNLKEVIIGNGITSIDDGTFEYCSSLTSIVWNAKNCEDFSSESSSPFYDIRSNITSFTFGNDVEHIPAYLCYEMGNLKEITIPKNVTSIGKYVFNNCSILSDVVWNARNCKNFTYDSPFYNISSNITSFTFGNEVEHIPAYLCYRMNKLTEVTIPHSVTSIGCCAFSCSSLSSVTIPNSITYIGNSAFSNCSALTSIVIPNSVLSIDSYAFDYCSALTKVNYLGTVDTWAKFDFKNPSSNPTYYAKDIYINDELLTEVNITSADSIKQYAFYNCNSIKSVEIGKSVTDIGNRAFNNCTNLKKVKNFSDLDIVKGKTTHGYVAYYADVVGNKIEGDFVFDHNDVITEYLGDINITKIEIPLKAKGVDKTVFAECTQLNTIVWNAKECNDFRYDSSPFYSIRSQITSFIIGNEVEYIPAYLCYGINNLKEVTLPKSVTSIGGCAFSDCSALTSVTIPNSVTSIGNSAFYDCSSLTSVEIGESVNEIGSYAFSGCSSLTSVAIPKSVTSIGNSAFYDCSSLTSVEIGESVNEIGSYAFSGCSSLTSVTIPKCVTSIGNVAFENCSGLTSVIWNAKNCEDFSSVSSSPFYDIRLQITSFTFGNEVERIPSELCYEMYKLTRVAIPNKVTFIDSYTFARCTGLLSLAIGNSVSTIGSYAFSGCRSLTTVNIPDNVNSINNYAFSECTGLSSVIIGNNVTSIGSYSFANCSNLTSVTLGERVRTIAQNAFSGSDRLRKVIAYPTSVPSVYKNSFAHYNAALYVPCDVYDEYYYDDIFGSFKETKCLAAEEVDEVPEKVEIEVDENNNAMVIWPSTGNAKSYELEIAKDGDVFCTLLFNENGQLTSVDFGNRSASVGFQFTVTGLDGASKYSYSMVALDKKGNELQSYKGTFTTSGYNEETAILETLADANITISDGLITCQDADFIIYNTLGQDVTALNGGLQPGIYIVALGEDRVKVMVK